MRRHLAVRVLAVVAIVGAALAGCPGGPGAFTEALASAQEALDFYLSARAQLEAYEDSVGSGEQEEDLSLREQLQEDADEYLGIYEDWLGILEGFGIGGEKAVQDLRAQEN